MAWVGIEKVLIHVVRFDYWGDWDCRDWINKSIEWWETEVAAIEKCLTDEKRDIIK